MPSTDWQEKTDPGELQRFEAYAEQLRDLQRRRARKGPVARALHAKGQLGLEAAFTVLPDLPEHARVGLFAAPGKFRACVRYSNGSGARQDDRKPDVRGIAVKVLGVAGKKLIPGWRLRRRRTSSSSAAPRRRSAPPTSSCRR
jgi:catalase